MKKVLQNSEKTRKFLNKLPKIYLVALWAHFGVRDFPFSGKYIKQNGIDVPLVYDYDDHNGTCDHYFLRPIIHTTTGYIFLWTQFKGSAEKTANILNKDFDTFF